MAVSPDIFIDAINNKLDQLEQEIDQKLTDAANPVTGNHTETICIRVPSIDSHLLSLLKPRYLAAGWLSVTKDSYGEYITFKYKIDLTKIRQSSGTTISPEEIRPSERRLTL